MEPGGIESDKAQGVASVIYEYLGLCVNWERMIVPGKRGEEAHEAAATETGTPEGTDQSDAPADWKKEALKDAVRILVTKCYQEQRKQGGKEELDLDRAGIVMFRIP